MSNRLKGAKSTCESRRPLRETTLKSKVVVQDKWKELRSGFPFTMKRLREEPFGSRGPRTRNPNFQHWSWKRRNRDSTLLTLLSLPVLTRLLVSFVCLYLGPSLSRREEDLWLYENHRLQDPTKNSVFISVTLHVCKSWNHDDLRFRSYYDSSLSFCFLSLWLGSFEGMDLRDQKRNEPFDHDLAIRWPFTV